jgi:hypothetical protein
VTPRLPSIQDVTIGNGSIRNETKAAGTRSAQIRIATASPQSFRLTINETSNFTQQYFFDETGLQFDGANFMQLIYSVYDPP